MIIISDVSILIRVQVVVIFKVPSLVCDSAQEWQSIRETLLVPASLSSEGSSAQLTRSQLFLD